MYEMPSKSFMPPFTHHVCETSGVPIHYVEGPASGPALLVVHGGTLQWQTFHPILPALAERWHLYACDLRGHGQSGWRSHGYRLLDYAEDLLALLHDGVETPTSILGHSIGGLAALSVAAQAPQLVRALVLEDPPIHFRDTRLVDHPFHAYFAALFEILRSRPSVDDISRHLAARQPHADPAIIAARAAVLSQVDPDVIEMLLSHEQMDGYDMDQVMAHVRCPVLLLQADPAQGAALEDDDVTYAQDHLGQCEVVHFSGVGHNIHLEAPERMVEALTRFLLRDRG
jgi:pimeloyl-ACP methyl ester carboxylesterase